MIELLNTVDYVIDGQVYALSNIAEAYTLKRANIDKTFLYQDEIVQAGETLESISYRVYETVEYWWVIALVNKIVNPYLDLPLTPDLLVEYTKSKYSQTDGIIHFMDTRIDRICDDVDDARYRQMIASHEEIPHHIVAISYMDHEVEQNAVKAKIKVVNPQFISTFVETVKGLLDAE